MFQRVLLGVPHHNVLQGVQLAAQRRNAQIVEMASTKRRTRLVQVNENMLPQHGCIWIFMLATTRDEW